MDSQFIKSSYTDLNVIEVNHKQHYTSGPAGQALSAELKRSKDSNAIRNF